MIKLIAFLKRKPGMSMDEFTQRWVYEHTKISAQMPGLRGYYINIAGATQPDTGMIYDGTAELWWDSLEDMERAFASDIGVAAGKDADEFCEVRIHLYTQEYEVLPGPHNRAQE